MKTSYFTFGQNHVHIINGFKYDKDCVLKIRAPEPRDVMFQVFGPKWSMEYDEIPDLRFYSRGVIEFPF